MLVFKTGWKGDSVSDCTRLGTSAEDYQTTEKKRTSVLIKWFSKSIPNKSTKSKESSRFKLTKEKNKGISRCLSITKSRSYKESSEQSKEKWIDAIKATIEELMSLVSSKLKVKGSRQRLLL